MKHKLALLLTALLFMTGFIPTTSAAARVFIEIGDRPYYIHGPGYAVAPGYAYPGSVTVEVGDRPYYTRGPGYYVGPSYYVWVPGHWAWRHHHRVWIHGHYGLR